MEHVGLTNFESVVLTEMGIKKTYDLKGDRDKVPEVVKQLSDTIRPIKPMTIGEERVGGGCGCGSGEC